jgi:broad specificity phosphatase PhoE
MLILVRHGRTALNAGGRLLGRLDPPLDELGGSQAAQLAAALVGIGNGRVVTSPLLRARQTAAAIAEALGGDVDVDERWIELDYGDFDGVAMSDVPTEVWASWRADPSFRPPGGETLIELGERVRTALAELEHEVTTRDVVVVSHVSPIKAAVASVLGVGDEVAWRLFLGPASITRVRFTAVGASLVGFNEVAHLGGSS